MRRLQKFEKNTNLDLAIISDSKKMGDFFQILWPSHNIWTLVIFSVHSLFVFISRFFYFFTIFFAGWCTGSMCFGKERIWSRPLWIQRRYEVVRIRSKFANNAIFNQQWIFRSFQKFNLHYEMWWNNFLKNIFNK